MKYAPLVWSALWHKPAEAVLTWLTVTVAFALFGLMLGVNATLRAHIDSAPEDVLSVYPRFPSARLQVGMREAIERIDGVSATSAIFILNGYHTDPRNAVTVITVDNRGSEATPQFRLQPDQWQRLFSTPDGLYVSEKAAARWNLKPGDTFIVNARRPGLRADGTSAFPFRVLDIVPYVPDSEGFLIGNFNYIDQVRPPQNQGRDVMFQVLVDDASRALEVSRQIDGLFANSGTPTFSISQRHASQNMANSSGNRALATSIVGAAGLFMILLLIANGIAQSVRERAPQLAVLSAIGFQNTALCDRRQKAQLYELHSKRGD